jgi:hypothetical protein
MSVHRSGFKAFASNLAVSGLVAAALGCWTGCIMEPAETMGLNAKTETTGSDINTQGQEKPTDASVNGIPRGCSREWSAAAHDSVVFCADIRPPKP